MVKRKKEGKALPKKQKSRAKYPCPDELKELIRLVNLIPYDFQLQNLTFELDLQRQALRKETGDPNAAPSILEAIKVCLKDTPEEFQQYLENLAEVRASPLSSAKPHMAKVYGVHELANAYSEYFEMRTSILRLLQRLETERQMMRDAEVRRQLKPGSITFQCFTLTNWDSYPLFISTVIKRDDDGKIHITGLAALIGKFDDSRLRRCVIDNRVFWAKREDSKTCSPRCLSVLNTRNSRALTDEEKAEKKAQREANSRRNKKLKEIRKIKNGTL